MTKVISLMAVLVAGLIGGAYHLYTTFVTEPVANEVIGEKAEKAIGDQVVRVVPANLNTKQRQLLTLAYDVAKENKLKHPEIVQAILLQETQAGGMHSYRVANPGPDAYFGPMQVKLTAARDVLAANPTMYAAYGFHTKTDDEVKANLILNDRFNLDVATKYLVILMQRYGLNGRDLMNAYNRGPGGVKLVNADEFHYALGAEQKLAVWKQSHR